MVVSKKAEKVAEAKYDVVYHYPNLDLHPAAVTGNVGLVHYALTHGQPVNSILHGLLPIHAACSGGSEQVVRMLIDRGADVNAPRLPRRYLDSKQQSTFLGHAGATPLHFAAANGHDKIVRILLACGAVQKPDKFGQTPEMVAEEAGHMDVVETLRTWEAMLDEEREKAREREEEEKKDLASEDSPQSVSLDSEALADEEEADDYISPTLDKTAAWKGKGRAASLSDRQQRMKIRKSLDNMFGGRRGGSLRVASGKGDKGKGSEPKRGESLDLARPTDLMNENVTDKADERRPSLPGLFGRVTHSSISLREALHRKSHASDAGSDIHLFRGRTRTQDSDESLASGPPSIRQLSKQSLLHLFRRGHNGSPPSLSPSPPRTTIPNLPTEDLDESVDRLKRLSMDGIRPTSAGMGRPRSASQVNFQNPLVSRSSSAAGSSASLDHSRPSSASHSKTEFGAENSHDENGEGGETDAQAGLQRRLSAGNSLKPLSRIDTQLANGKQGDEANEERKDLPKSILKTRTEGAPSPTSPRGFARLSPWHEPSTPSPLGGPKPRSATMPTSYFSSPLSPRKSEGRKSPVQVETDDRKHSGGVANDDSPDSDRREKEDGIGESIWDRAAARRSAKGRSRGASLTSIVSSAMSAPPQVPPLSFAMSHLSEPEGTDWTLSSQKHAARAPSIPRYGRSRNNTVSTMSTMASNGTYSSEAMESNLTPPSVSSSHFTSGSSVHPHSEDGLSVKERLVRRVSKRRGDGPDLLYAVPMKTQSEETGGDLQREKAKYEALERRRKTEQDIIRAVSDPRHESSISLAEQLAAYGDIMAIEANLSQGSHERPASASSSSEQVSRSYITRPALHKSSSTDSNATIKTENSRMVADKARKPSSVPGSSTHSGDGSLVGSNTDSTSDKMDHHARQEALRLVPSLDTLFTTHAPSTAIPSINRIYETRAAAYRDKGLALMKQAPLYGSSPKNPTRPPVKIEDHWLMAGLKQKDAQSEQQRVASFGAVSAPSHGQLGRAAVPPSVAVSHSEQPAMSSRKSSRSSEIRNYPVAHNKPGPKPTGAAKADLTTSAIPPGLGSNRPVETVPLRTGQTNGTVSAKKMTDSSAVVPNSNARRRASAPIGSELSSPESTVVVSTNKRGPEVPTAAGRVPKKAEQPASSRLGLGPSIDTRNLSGEADQTTMQTPTSGGSGSMVTPLATGHKHRWGDGFKSAMRLGKSKT